MVEDIKAHDSVLEYCQMFYDVLHGLSRSTLLSEAAYNASDVGLTQELMIDDDQGCHDGRDVM